MNNDSIIADRTPLKKSRCLVTIRSRQKIKSVYYGLESKQTTRTPRSRFLNLVIDVEVIAFRSETMRSSILVFILLVGTCLLETPILVGQEPTKDRIQVKDNGQQIIVSAGKQPILAYNHQVIKPPKGIDSLYSRSGHIHPIYTPAGRIVTDDFSDDHAHQHGLFFAYVKAKVEGEELDFWNQHRRTANVKNDGAKIDTTSPSKITTGQIHYRLRDNKPIFKEEWTIEPSLTKGCFVFDLTMKLTNVFGEKVNIEKNHYGSFGLRGSGQWRQAEQTGFDFATATGKNRKNGNLSQEKWVAMHGKVDGETCGIVVITHPKNFRFPQSARLHPTMPYFSFAPMATGSYEFSANESVVSRFRIVTFDGELDREKIESLGWQR